MKTNFGAGFHAAPGRVVDTEAYDRYIGRWSRLFVPAVLAAVRVAPGQRVLDVSTGTGEAALMALPIIGASGLVSGADISPAMVAAARDRLNDPSFWPVAADGQALPFADGSFDAVICHLGLQFFLDPALGLLEFRRVLRLGGCAAACVISTPDRAPMAGILADAISRFLPEQRNILYLSFALADPKQLEQYWPAPGSGTSVYSERHANTPSRVLTIIGSPSRQGSGPYPRHIFRSPKPIATRCARR